jgi:hypothetical protein
LIHESEITSSTGSLACSERSEFQWSGVQQDIYNQAKVCTEVSEEKLFTRNMIAPSSIDPPNHRQTFGSKSAWSTIKRGGPA